jgi:signal peptidase I
VIDEPQSSPARGKGSFWRELPMLLVIAIVVAVVVRAFVLQTFWIPSQSMENTLLVNDRVLVNKLIYNFRSPHRGEVVVFEAPANWRGAHGDEDIIKRIIGVPGDHIVCCDDRQRLVVNDHPIDEPYLYQTPDGMADVASEQPFDIVVPKGRYWMMGDHRSNSADSREHYIRGGGDITAATIPEDAIVGRAFVLFWPFDRADWLSVPETFEKIPDPPG